MSEFEGLKNQYRRVIAVDDLNETNLYLDNYIAHYKMKFKGQPIFDVSNAHLTTIKDIKKMGGVKTPELIEHYFTMDPDGWYSKQGYSLDCLKKNLHVVNASYSKKAHTISGSTLMQARVYCDCCGLEFTRISAIAQSFDKPVKCFECEQSGAEVKHVSKAERQEAIYKLGSAFPEVVDTPE